MALSQNPRPSHNLGTDDQRRAFYDFNHPVGPCGHTVYFSHDHAGRVAGVLPAQLRAALLVLHLYEAPGGDMKSAKKQHRRCCFLCRKVRVL